jgi:hypothetical protein
MKEKPPGDISYSPINFKFSKAIPQNARFFFFSAIKPASWVLVSDEGHTEAGIS